MQGTQHITHQPRLLPFQLGILQQLPALSRGEEEAWGIQMMHNVEIVKRVHDKQGKNKKGKWVKCEEYVYLWLYSLSSLNQ